MDYGALVEGVARLLERKGFRPLKAGMRLVAKHVLSEFPPVREITITITKLRVSTDREISGVSVEGTFSR